MRVGAYLATLYRPRPVLLYFKECTAVDRVILLVENEFQARGDVPSLAFVVGDTFTGTVAVSTAGSLQGIDPPRGTFELGYGGEKTSPLYADATAGAYIVHSILSAPRSSIFIRFLLTHTPP